MLGKFAVATILLILFALAVAECKAFGLIGVYRLGGGKTTETNKAIASDIADGQSFSLTTCSNSLSMISAMQVVANDTNWAGYIVASDLQNPQPTVTSIGAFWTVPTVVISSNDTFSAVWLGIGGVFDQSLIQVGTEQDSIQGQSDYSAWLELLPQTSITIDTIIISPGDQINASIQLIDTNTDQWSISIEDLTTSQEFSDNFYYAASQLSAEWIVERPEISTPRSHGTLTALADVGRVKFADCEATMGDKTGHISSFSCPSINHVRECAKYG